MLHLDNVGKTYDDGSQALAQISIDVPDGEVLALLGASGCGKTTLLRIIAGLEHASTGSVVIDGTRIVEPHAAIGLVFQEPRLLPWLTVAENVAFGLRATPLKPRDASVARILDRVGLGRQAAKLPRDLSGGQQQRAALARALVVKPDVLLLDEPFSALDAVTREELQDHLMRLWADDAPTIVIVTHDVDEAVALADRVAIMKPHPGQVASIAINRLPRPRDRESLDFITLRRDLRSQLTALTRSNRVAGPCLRKASGETFRRDIPS